MVKRSAARRFLSLGRGGNVEIAIGVLAAALFGVREAHAEAPLDGLGHLWDERLASEVDDLLRQAVARGGVEQLTLEQLAELLTPDRLAELGLDAKEFLSLLDADPEAALARLEAAFAQKLKLASFASVHQAAFHADGADQGGAQGGGEGAASAAGVGGSEGGLSPLLIVGGVLGVGLGAGLALSGGSGSGSTNGSSGGQAVNSPPLANPDNITTAEDAAITFDPRLNDTDANNDALTITQINGTAITTTTTVAVTGGVVALNASGALTFTPSANYNGAPSFTYTVSDGRGGTNNGTVNLTVTPVNDAPVNAVANAALSGAQGAAIAISGLSVSDIDSTSLTTTLKVSAGVLGVGSVLNGAAVTGAGTDTLVLSGTAAQINASLAAINFQGGSTLFGQQTITITTSDGVLTDTDTLTLNIAQMTSGVVADGYISGAQVFIDVNNNGVLDGGEPAGTTDANGRFAFAGSAAGPLVAIGGVNTDTGLANTVVLRAPLGSGVVNPLTTVVQGLVETGMTVAQANAMFVQSLGLPAGTDITNLDILAPTTDPTLALAAQKVAAQIVFTLEAAAAAGGESAATALAGKLAALVSAGGPLDLGNAVTLTTLFTDAGLSPAAAASAALTTASNNQAVASSTSLGDIAGHQLDAADPNHDYAPVTANDVFTVERGASVDFDPRVNDQDPEGSALRITKVNGVAIVVGQELAVAGGVIRLNADGGLTFSSNGPAGALGVITYAVADAAGNETVGQINGAVTTPANVAPVLVADTFSTPANGSFTFAPLANDSDADGDSLSISSINGISVSVGQTILVDGGTLRLNADNTLTFIANYGAAGTVPTISYTATDGNGHAVDSTIDLTIAAPTSDTLSFVSADLGAVTAAAGALAAQGIVHLDVDGAIDANVSLSDVAAGALISAGLDFADGDVVSVQMQGTTTSTTLKGLETLHVDAVAVAGGILTLETGAGGFAGLDANGLPSFTIAQSDAAADITLNVGTGEIDQSLNLSGIASALAAAGIDHIGATGASGSLELSGAQALDLVTAGLDFTAADDITVNLATSQLGSLTALAGAHVDHIDMIGDLALLDDTTAATLIAAGVDFADGDTVTVQMQGTTTSTTLKGLETLHVDSVAVAGGILTLEAGAGGFTGLGADGLPSFTIAQSDAAADITLNVGTGEIDQSLNLSGIASALAAAGIDHIGATGASGSLELSGAQALDLVNAGLDFTAADDITVNLETSQLGSLTALAGAHVDHIDMIGDLALLDDTTAATLIAAGVDFADGDTVTVQMQGTTTSTTLKGLETLHVDSVAVAGGILTLEAGAGGFTGLGADGLPSFTIAQSDAAADITLNVGTGEIDQSLNLSGIASALAAAGIDHIGATGASGSLELSGAQALDLVTAGLDFTAADDITVNLATSQLGSLTALAGAHVDHIDMIGDLALLDDTTAATLIAAGVDFADGDMVTVQMQGTTTSTTLKGLETLHVDSVAVAGGILTIEAGAGGFAGLATDHMPSFTIAQGDAAADITLDVGTGLVDPSLSLSGLASAFATAGIDHVGATGANGSLELAGHQALDLVNAGLTFTEADDITVHLAAADLGSVVNLGLAHVDHIDMVGDVASVDDGAAALLVASGLDFATGDDVTVHAQGTHMATSLEGLQSLHVDTVNGDGFSNILKVAVGLDGLAAISTDPALLPQFNTALDVTLDISVSDLDNLATRAAALYASGIDHIGLNQPLSSLSPEQLAAIANIEASSHLTFTHDPTPAAQNDFGSLIAHLEANPADPVDTPVTVPDALAASLVESGALHALINDTLTLDATQSGDHLLTSLKSMADLGVDSVVLANHGADPIYIDLGFESATPTAGELSQLLDIVDPTPSDPLFTGASHVGLVLDQPTLDALAGIDGSIAHLQDLGFTEIDVVGGTSIPDAFAGAPIEIKLIGVTDDLYDYLHHPR